MTHDDVTSTLRSLVQHSRTSAELERRVIEACGSAMVPNALAIALELKGREWLESKNPVNVAPARAGRIIRWVRHSPSLAVLLTGGISLLILLLFPPYMVPLPQGRLQNAGFAAIWDPPEYGSLVAVVNTPLLAVLAVGVVAVTACMYLLFRRLELASRMKRDSAA